MSGTAQGIADFSSHNSEISMNSKFRINPKPKCNMYTHTCKLFPTLVQPAGLATGHSYTNTENQKKEKESRILQVLLLTQLIRTIYQRYCGSLQGTKLLFLMENMFSPDTRTRWQLNNELSKKTGKSFLPPAHMDIGFALPRCALSPRAQPQGWQEQLCSQLEPISNSSSSL